VNIPLPPTDNLYKFIAIFGLVVTVVGFVFPRILIFDLQTQIIKLQGEVVVLQAIAHDLHPKPDGKDFVSTYVEVKAKLQVIEGLARQIESLAILFAIGVGAGVFLMLNGFSFWYLRVQRYQDKILKNDAEKRLTHRSTRTRAPTARSG